MNAKKNEAAAGQTRSHTASPTKQQTKSLIFDTKLIKNSLCPDWPNYLLSNKN